MHTSKVFQCHYHSAQGVILGDYIDAKYVTLKTLPLCLDMFDSV